MWYILKENLFEIPCHFLLRKLAQKGEYQGSPTLRFNSPKRMFSPWMISLRGSCGSDSRAGGEIQFSFMPAWFEKRASVHSAYRSSFQSGCHCLNLTRIWLHSLAPLLPSRPARLQAAMSEWVRPCEITSKMSHACNFYTWLSLYK